MSSIYNPSRTRMTDYDVTWNSVFLGGVDKVTPDLQYKTMPVKIGSVGDVKIGERIVALEGTVKVELREVDLAQIEAMLPWWTSGQAVLFPAIVNEDRYSLAQPLKLHPIDLAGTTTEDIHLTFAFPVIDFFEGDGKTDNKMVITFEFYPDRSQLPVLSYGYVGT